MDVAPMVALGIVALTLTNLVKYLRAGNWNGVLTLIAAWVIGVGVLWLFGATSMAHGVTINGTTLDHLKLADKIVFGLVVGSLGSFGFDLQKALDNTQTSAKPALTTGVTDTILPVVPAVPVPLEALPPIVGPPVAK